MSFCYHIRGSVSELVTSAINVVEIIHVSLIPNKGVKQACDYFMPRPGLEFLKELGRRWVGVCDTLSVLKIVKKVTPSSQK